MDPVISSYIVIVAMSGVFNAVLALLAYYKKSDFAGTNAFMLIAAASAVYTFGFALELSGNSLNEIMFWIKVEYLGMPLIAPASVVMVTYFIGLERLLTRAKLVFLFGIPVITTIMVWTNEYHHLFYRSVYFRQDSPTPMVDIVIGPWYVVHGSMTFGCLLAATILMFTQWKRMKDAYMRQFITIVIGQVLPTAGSLLYLLGLTPYGMDPVPVIMSITSMLYIWAILSRGMLTAAPVARENLFASMRDGVLVLDHFDRLVDFNGAAAKMVDGLAPSSIGRPLAQLLLQAGPQATAYVLKPPTASELEEIELEWLRQGETAYYQIRSSPVRKRGGQLVGRMIMLIDVTERMLLQQKLEQLATVDSLTGIYNRTHFLDLAGRLLQQASACGETLCVILLDIDHFKRINDSYGHDCGDKALQFVVEIARRHLRDGDLFGRYGGEEFVLCLPSTSLHEAAGLSEAIREDISVSRLVTGSGTLDVTASFGVAESAASGSAAVETLLLDADRALYASKRSGRNSVHVASGTEFVPFA